MLKYVGPIVWVESFQKQLFMCKQNHVIIFKVTANSNFDEEKFTNIIPDKFLSKTDNTETFMAEYILYFKNHEY